MSKGDKIRCRCESKVVNNQKNVFDVWKGVDETHRDGDICIRLEDDGKIYVSSQAGHVSTLISKTVDFDEFNQALRFIISQQHMLDSIGKNYYWPIRYESSANAASSSSASSSATPETTQECLGTSFSESTTIKDQWESGGEQFRLIDIGAGPLLLQVMDNGEWRAERPHYALGVLCDRLEEKLDS